VGEEILARWTRLKKRAIRRARACAPCRAGEIPARRTRETPLWLGRDGGKRNGRGIAAHGLAGLGPTMRSGKPQAHPSEQDGGPSMARRLASGDRQRGQEVMAARL
jgi:hypothetical protein